MGNPHKLAIDFSGPEFNGLREYRKALGPGATMARAVEELVLLGSAAVKEDASIIIGRVRAYRESSHYARTKLAAALREIANDLEARKDLDLSAVNSAGDVSLP